MPSSPAIETVCLYNQAVKVLFITLLIVVWVIISLLIRRTELVEGRGLESPHTPGFTVYHIVMSIYASTENHKFTHL